MSTLPSDEGGTGGYRILLLGPVVVERDGLRLETARWQRWVESLLILLVTGRERRVRRDQLIDLLWPDAKPQAGTGNLRYIVHLLRKNLGHPLFVDTSPVLSERGWVGLNPVYTWDTDLERFEWLVQGESDRLEEALLLYRGEPLVEHRYENWAESLQERIQRNWGRLCLQLARQRLGAGRGTEAIDLLQQLLDGDSVDEEALRMLVTALVAAGRRGDAVRHYRRFERRLQEELGVSPMAETVAAVEQFFSPDDETGMTAPDTRTELAPVIPSYPLSTTEPLIGREAEVARVLDALPPCLIPGGEDSPRVHAPRLILLASGAGMGKTRLLAEVGRLGRERGALTLAGGSHEREGRLPYGPIHDALLDYVRSQPWDVVHTQLGLFLPDLLGIVPELLERVEETKRLPAADADSRRLRLYAAVMGALDRIAREQPVLLLLDDLHWADAATLHLLHFVLRRGENLLVVGTYRDDEVGAGEPLAEMVREAEQRGWTECLHLSPLDQPKLTAVLERQLGGTCSPELATTLHGRSGGNPFFALQMLALLQTEGNLERTGYGWRRKPGASAALPAAISETLMRRLRALGPDEREALALGSVLGVEFDYPALYALWEGNERSLFAALDTAVAQHLIREAEAGYTFQHPLLWEAVYERVPVPRRALLHERTGLALERLYAEGADAHAAELAYHFAAAGRVHLSRTLRYLTLAGDAAARAFDWKQAAELYRRALSMAQGTVCAVVLERLAGVLTALGNHVEAIEALDQAACTYRDVGDAEAEGRIVAQIGFAHYGLWSLDRGIARLDGAIRSFPVDETERNDEGVPLSVALTSLCVEQARLLLRSRRRQESLEVAERAVELAGALGADHLLLDAEVRRGSALGALGRRAEARTFLEQAIERAGSAGASEIAVSALMSLTTLAMEAGDFTRCREDYARLLSIAEQRRSPMEIAFATDMLGYVLYLLGHWQEARAHFERARLDASAAGRESTFLTPLLHLAELAASEGRSEESRLYLEACFPFARERGDDGALADAQRLLAFQDLLHGRSKKARARLQPLVEHLDDSTFPSWIDAWAALEAGDVDGAAAAMRRRVALARDMDDRFHLVDGLRMLGMALARKGRRSEAAAALLESVALAEDMRWPYAKALALYEYGLLPDVDGASTGLRVESLEEANSIFRRLGARPWMQRTQRALQ